MNNTNYIVNDFTTLQEYFSNISKKITVELFYDVETLTVNRSTKEPSKLKSIEYAFTFSIFINKKLYIYTFPSCERFLKKLDELNVNGNTIHLIAHNAFKFDNHYLRYTLTNIFKLPSFSLFQKNIKEVEGLTLLKKSQLTPELKKGCVLESRVKSSTNLGLTFYFNGVKYETLDTYPRTSSSLATLGVKLKNAGLIDDKYLKTEYQYDIFDQEEDMDIDELLEYRNECFQKITQEMFVYIYNDVVILAYTWLYFDKLFLNFDRSKSTFMQNVKKEYLVSKLSQFQLEHKIDNERVYEYSHYRFRNVNYFNYLNAFYRGGLNIYNDEYVGTTVSNAFSIDINSSYPAVLYTEEFPHTIHRYSEYPTNVKWYSSKYIYYLELSIEQVNSQIISKIPSNILKKMIVKYYHFDYTTSNIYISSIVLKSLIDDFNIDISKSIRCVSYVSYTKKPFDAREIISKYYYIKSQGKSKYKLIYQSPTDIVVDRSTKNDVVFNEEEVYISKVYLNGIYGLPALRLYFDYFYYNNIGELTNNKKGFKNSERNVLLSATVTAYAFRNLIKPLSYLTPDEIDDAFIYADTDSLYLKKYALSKLPPILFHDLNIGKWSVDCSNILKINILNHKKYCYLTDKLKIKVKSAGVHLDSFNTNLDFDEFINTQFKHGSKVNTLNSILNTMGSISLYNSVTEFKMGTTYPKYYSKSNFKAMSTALEVLEEDLDSSNTLLYIETPFGSVTDRDMKHDEDLSNTQPISDLVYLESTLKEVF